jgi:hypothetical protein
MKVPNKMLEDENAARSFWIHIAIARVGNPAILIVVPSICRGGYNLRFPNDSTKSAACLCKRATVASSFLNPECKLICPGVANLTDDAAMGSFAYRCHQLRQIWPKMAYP